MQLRNILLVIIIGSMISSCSLTTVRRTSDHISALRDKKIVVLPPKVEVNMLEFSGKKQRMYDFEYYLEGIIADNITEILHENHLKSKFLHRREIYDKKLVETDGRIQDRANEILGELYTTVSMPTKQAYEIQKNIDCSIASDLGTKSDSDVIAIVQYDQKSKTTGAKTGEFLMAVLVGSSSNDKAAERSVMLISFFDAKTGKLIWSNLALDEKSIFGAMTVGKSHRAADAKHLRALMTNTLRPIWSEK
jgi:hypothetical protein